MITVTKQFNFCYAHFLPDYDGKCVNLHGHNSVVEMEFTCPGIETYPGMVVDFTTIKKEINPIIEQLDHKFLNKDLPEITPPTAENIVQWIVDHILSTPLGPGLIRVRVSETPTSWTEWRV